MRRARRIAAALIVPGLTLLTTGCVNLAQLNFRVDDRLHFTAPDDRALVRAPLRISWTMRDFTPAAPGHGPVDNHVGYFAVFLDRAPIKPGSTLDAVAGNDQSCKLDPTCPNKEYLAVRGVFTTVRPTITLERVPPLTDTGDDTQLHDVIVVLLDTSGHRIGESAWHITFKMKKPTF